MHYFISDITLAISFDISRESALQPHRVVASQAARGYLAAFNATLAVSYRTRRFCDFLSGFFLSHIYDEILSSLQIQPATTRRPQYRWWFSFRFDFGRRSQKISFR